MKSERLKSDASDSVEQNRDDEDALVFAEILQTQIPKGRKSLGKKRTLTDLDFEEEGTAARPKKKAKNAVQKENIDIDALIESTEGKAVSGSRKGSGKKEGRKAEKLKEAKVETKKKKKNVESPDQSNKKSKNFLLSSDDDMSKRDVSDWSDSSDDEPPKYMTERGDDDEGKMEEKEEGTLQIELKKGKVRKVGEKPRYWEDDPVAWKKWQAQER